MILHLIHDDNKVVPRMIAQFEEVCPGNNVFLCIVRACDNNDLRFLKDNPKVIKSNSNEEDNIPWSKIDKICIHYLNFSKLKYFWKLRFKHGLNKCKLIWFIWSGDIYDIIERKGFELYSSNNSYLDIRRADRKGDKTLKSLLKKLSLSFKNSVADSAKCYFLDKKLDYIVCNSRDEFELFSRYLRFSKCKELLNYSYYPLEDTLGSLMNKEINGNSIIIGNSASESNNHEYVLSIIEALPIRDRKVYVPLSYGNDVEYIKIIESKYSRLPNAVILKEFLPLEEYHKLLMSCSTFIYGNFRSEAWGNILVALYLGGKVYVSEKSFLSKYLKTEGYKYFITESIKDTIDVILTDEEKNHNREIAMETWSREKNIKNIEYINSL